MKKDIEFPEVEGVKVAIARQVVDQIQEDYDWHVYLLNYNSYPLSNVLITAKGYGQVNGEKQRTSTIRYAILELSPDSYTIIEKIDPSVFHLCSEYWVSYYVGNQIYDKKFVFLPETIVEDNIRPIDMLEMHGIMHG
jgi:hypothetical protein